MSVQGKTLRSQSQQLLLNLLTYFEKEKENGGHLLPLSCVQERAAQALGIGIATVKRIKARSRNQPVLVSPGKKRSRKKSKTADLPESSKLVIRETVYKMYSEKKHITLKSLNDELQEYHILIGRSSLNVVLHDLGFKFLKDNNRRALVEKSNIASLRLQFLKRYMANINLSSPLQTVFMDETWIYSKGNPGKSWQDSNIQSVRKPEGYEGKRFIVVHAGCTAGFIKNASLLFATKSLKEDYHGEMNSEMFKKWLVDNLLNNLEEPSLIIMDNAPYHSTLVEKQPSSSWTKRRIIDWLNNSNIPHDPTSFRLDLLKLAKLHRKDKVYEVDDLIRSHGHEVLRLPPYHCEFNAIELIWAYAKKYYDDHIGRDGYGGDKVLSMWTEALHRCSPEIWSACVASTERKIKEWYEREKVLDLTVDKLLIDVSNDSSDSSSDSDTD